MEQCYVGIDLHRRRSVIVHKDAAGTILSSVQLANDDLAGFSAELARAGEHPEVVLEATYGHPSPACPCQEKLLEEADHRVQREDATKETVTGFLIQHLAENQSRRRQGFPPAGLRPDLDDPVDSTRARSGALARPHDATHSETPRRSSCSIVTPYGRRGLDKGRSFIDDTLCSASATALLISSPGSARTAANADDDPPAGPARR